MPSIVIATNGNHFARRILSPVLRCRDFDVVQIIHVTGDYYGRSGLSAARLLIHRMAFRFFLFKLLQHLLSEVLDGAVVAKMLQSPVKGQDVPVMKVRSINDPAVQRLLDTLSPDLLVSVSCPQKIPAKLFASTKYGGLNLHSSLLPAYAGLAPYFWVLANGEAMTGTTVHWMTERFDQGDILVQNQLPVEAGVSVFGLFRSLAGVGSETLLLAVKLALDGVRGREQDLSRSSYYSHPTAQACRDLKRHGHCLMKVADWVNLLRDIPSRHARAQASVVEKIECEH